MVASVEQTVALIGVGGSILVVIITALLQVFTNKLDRSHAERAERFVEINTKEHLRSVSINREILSEVGEIKADVRDVKADVRDLRGRVGDLETDRETTL